MRNIAAKVMSLMMVCPYNKLRQRIGAPIVKDIEGMMSSRLNLIPIGPRVVPSEGPWAPPVRLMENAIC